MTNNIVNNYSSTFIQIFNDVIKQYESGLDTIKQTEEELNDIYHEIELGKNQDMYHIDNQRQIGEGAKSLALNKLCRSQYNLRYAA